MTMIEKIARAIYRKSEANLPFLEQIPWDETSDYARERVMEIARAAVEAMREPSVTMLFAVKNRPPPLSPMSHEAGILYEIEQDYRAMIDAILNEQEPK